MIWFTTESVKDMGQNGWLYKDSLAQSESICGLLSSLDLVHLSHVFKARIIGG